ncbi:MAG: amino acid permease [Sulfurimonadaceae bacterium]|nr:amino acid permease [Sulfurimonadaceae bacterium]
MQKLSTKIFRKKVYAIGEGGFEKRLSATSLVLLGVGAIIGAGIFVITGKAAATMAGPAIILSFIFAAIALGITALVYAELGTNIPVAGSAYSYTYSTLGEFLAWMVGWNLLLEYGLIVPAVSAGWSGYFRAFMENAFSFKFPAWLSGAYGTSDGSFVDIFALIMTALVFILLTFGIKKTSTTNAWIVAIKFIVLGLFVFTGFKYINFELISDFMPFGWGGVLSATSLIVFAYLGFDALSTVAEETKDVQRSLPIGLIGSLTLSTLLYIVVSFILVSILPYQKLDVPDALAYAMFELDEPLVGLLISGGAVVTITSVLIVMGVGLTRVIYALSRDGLLPKSLATLHPRTNAPYKITILSGVFASLFAGFVPLGVLAELINIGTLFAYLMIGVAVIMLRKAGKSNGFRVPFGKVLLPLNVLFMAVLMYGLSGETWVRFLIWGAVGVLVYIFYGSRKSELNV